MLDGACPLQVNGDCPKKDYESERNAVIAEPMPRKRIVYNTEAYAIPADFPRRLDLFKEA